MSYVVRCGETREGKRQSKLRQRMGCIMSDCMVIEDGCCDLVGVKTVASMYF